MHAHTHPHPPTPTHTHTHTHIPTHPHTHPHTHTDTTRLTSGAAVNSLPCALYVPRNCTTIYGNQVLSPLTLTSIFITLSLSAAPWYSNKLSPPPNPGRMFANRGNLVQTKLDVARDVCWLGQRKWTILTELGLVHKWKPPNLNTCSSPYSYLPHRAVVSDRAYFWPGIGERGGGHSRVSSSLSGLSHQRFESRLHDSYIFVQCDSTECCF